jgi:hypothetical protein
MDEDSENKSEYRKIQKTAYDYIKHLTTLCTGSLVLIGTLRAIAHSPKTPWLSMVAFIFFSISVLVLTFSAFFLFKTIRDGKPLGASAMSFITGLFLVGLFSFIFGFSFLVIFALNNWIL